MATNLANPTPDERGTLATNTQFIPYVKASMIAQAAAAYDPTLREKNWNKYAYIQMAMLDAELNGAPLSQRLAEVIAWHPQAPAAFFTLADFSTVDAATLDAAVLKAFNIVAGQ